MQENVHKQKKEPLAQPTTPQDLSQSQDPIGQYMQPPWLGGIQGGKGWRMDGLAHKNSSGPWGAAGALRAHNPGGGAFGPRPSVCRKSGLRHFFEVFIAPLRLRRGQGAMQGNPCYARLFADLTRMSPNPIIASGGCGPRTPGGFSTGCGAPLIGSGALALFMGAGRGISKGAAGLWSLRRPIPAFVHIGNVPLPCARHGPAGGAAAGRFAPCAREAGAFSPCLPRAVCGPGGRRPPGPQTPPPPALPPPSAGAAAFRGRGQRPRPRNKPAAGRCPAAGGWAAPPPRRAGGAWGLPLLP